MAKRNFPVLTTRKRKKAKPKPLLPISSLRSHTRKGQIIWNTSYLCTYLVSPQEDIKSDLPGIYTRIYTEKHRVYQGELCGKGPCVALWVSGNLMIQLDPALVSIAPAWLREGTRVDLQSIDLIGSRWVNHLMKYLMPLNPQILPAWNELASTPPNCIPTGWKISSDFILTSELHRKNNTKGAQICNNREVPKCDWHLLFLEHGIIRLMLPGPDLEKLWNQFTSCLPNLIIGDQETLHKWQFEHLIPTFPVDYMLPNDLSLKNSGDVTSSCFPFKVVRRVVKSSYVCPGAQLTDLATGDEIGIVTSANSSGYGIALINSEFSQDQCVLLNVGTQRAHTAQTAHILPMPK